VHILYLTTVLPDERLTGSEVVSAGFADALRSLGHQVTMVGYRRKGRTGNPHPDDVSAASRAIETSEAGLTAAWWMAAALVTGRPYSVRKFMSRAYRREARTPADVVIVDHSRISWAAPADGFVYLAHNDEHALYAQLAEKGGRGAALYRREAARIRPVEEAMAQRAAQVWALTESDAQAMARHGARETRVFNVPSTALPGPPGEPAYDVALLGSWTWAANAEGLRWFVEQVVPHLPPEIDVHVGGAGSEPVAAGAPVTLRGRVPDAMTFLQGARVVAAPSVSGSGVQVKTLDAIATGRPVVATPVAARGIAGLPSSVRVEEAPQAFAEAIVAAVREPATGHGGREWAEARAAAFRDQLRDALEALR
jgi:glycosyltransferase involved in cell wall biosynthesis